MGGAAAFTGGFGGGALPGYCFGGSRLSQQLGSVQPWLLQGLSQQLRSLRPSVLQDLEGHHFLMFLSDQENQLVGDHELLGQAAGVL